MTEQPGNRSVNAQSEDPPGDSSSWFERPGNIRLMIALLCISCAGLVLADRFYQPHPHFAVESFFGFNAWFGFIAFVVIVFLGRLLRLIVRRDEDYYDR